MLPSPAMSGSLPQDADGDQVGAVFGRHHGQVGVGDDGFGGGDESRPSGCRADGAAGPTAAGLRRASGAGPALSAPAKRGQHGILALLVQTEQFDTACFHAGHRELEAVGTVVEDDQVHERVVGRAQDELGEVGRERDAGRDHVGDVEVEDEGMGDAGCVLDLELVDPGGERHWHVGVLSVDE